jgi:hypothetical protein
MTASDPRGLIRSCRQWDWLLAANRSVAMTKCSPRSGRSRTCVLTVTRTKEVALRKEAWVLDIGMHGGRTGDSLDARPSAAHTQGNDVEAKTVRN